MHLYPIDGAAHDVGPSDTAWSYRDATWGSVFAGVDPDPANVGAIRDWSVDYHEALHPYSAGGAYVNMMMDEGQERVRASYRDNYDRLARIKATYDPDNLFRVNQNIAPGASAPAAAALGRAAARRPPAAAPGTARRLLARHATRPVASHARGSAGTVRRRRPGAAGTPPSRRPALGRQPGHVGARGCHRPAPAGPRGPYGAV